MKSEQQANRATMPCVYAGWRTSTQFPAPLDAELLVCEAVSAKSVPKNRGDLDYGVAGASNPNPSQMDLAYAAQLSFRVLKQVYRVADFGSGRSR